MIPRGIEVLVKKASIDEEFRSILLQQRQGAADVISLELTDSETAMLRDISEAQLETIICRTKVEPQNRRVFLGKAAAAMLAAVVAGAGGCDGDPPLSKGSQPDRPPEKS